MSKADGKANGKRRPRGQWYIDRRKGSKIWYVYGQNQATGERIRRSTGTTSKDHAEGLKVKWEQEALDEFVYGRMAVATFGGALRYYLDNKDPGSLLRHLNALYDEFGDVRINDLTSAMLRDYANREHAHCSGQVKNKYVIEPMLTVIRYAAKDQLCSIPQFHKFEGQSAKIDAAPEEWIYEFLSRTSNTKVRALVLMLTTTGARCIDARRLAWDDIDWDLNEIRFRRTKNGDDRLVPVRGDLLAMLYELKQCNGGTGPFPHSRTDIANKEIQKECKRLGMDYYPCHRLGRHAFAERLLRDGVPLKDAKEAGGWRSLQVFEERYGHLERGRSYEIVREQAEKFNVDFERGRSRG